MSQPLDRTAKQRIKEALLAHDNAELRTSRQHVGDLQSAAVLDQDDSYSVDDQAQTDEAGDQSALFERVTDRQESIIAQVEELDFSPADEVRPGAVITFGGGSYVVGVIADPFVCDGVTYEGISADSPVAEATQGLRAGDTFTVNGTTHRLDTVS